MILCWKLSQMEKSRNIFTIFTIFFGFYFLSLLKFRNLFVAFEHKGRSSWPMKFVSDNYMQCLKNLDNIQRKLMAGPQIEPGISVLVRNST